MPQDGSKGPAQATAPSSNTESGATMLLTLCLSSSSVNQRHATVPYLASYGEACRKALNVFAAYLPTETIAVSLHRASKRADGTWIWSIIEEDDWEIVIQQSGEEIGVFPPDHFAGPVSYVQGSTRSSKKFVHFFIFTGFYRSSFCEIMVVNSFEECKLAAMNFLKASSTREITLSFDERMFGTATEMDDYANSVLKKDAHLCSWKVIHNSQMFDFLFERNTLTERPVPIKAHQITETV